MRPTVTTIERDLRRLLQGDVEFDAITRHLYATDGSNYQIEPLGVISPRNREDVVNLVRYATENEIPLVARGAGSGLAGAAVGAGLQVDFTRYMTRILEVAADGSWARVEPGVVMAVLNESVRQYGTFFAPNPSSENYCTFGGMIANNSSGSRSVAYGGTKDHVIALEVVLSGGETLRLSSRARSDESPGHSPARSALGDKALARLLPLLEAKREVILASMPRVAKNCSGYRVESVISDDLLHPQMFFIGSEGTLGLIIEATIKLSPLPDRRAIGMAYFPTVFTAGEAVFPILELKPTSLEIMDSSFLGLVRRNYPKIDAMLPQAADTALLIEFEATDDAELDDKLTSLETLLAGGAALEVVRALDPREQKQLWQVRQAAVPLMQKLPGPKRIVEFIEDVTVHPEVLATYMSTLSGILDRYGVDKIMYGHAGDGNIHTRPVLNVKDAGDIRMMQNIMDEVMDFVFSIKGTPSGEHGDGLVRSSYVRKLYGDEVYALFQEIKTAFDPTGIMNPGKKVAAEAEAGGVTRNIRYGPNYWTFEQTTVLNFPDGEYEREIEKCHGCAQCKSLVGTTMCPIYQATKREHASPRAKANLLRNVIQGKLPPYDTYAEEATKAVTDYCIECGMCAIECPSNVNIPKLMLEAKSRYRAAHRSSKVELILGHAELLSRGGQLASPVANRLVNVRPLRRVGQRITGLDHRRTLPPFARRTFAQMLKDRDRGLTQPLVRPSASEGSVASGSSTSVALLYDVYANYHEPALAQRIDSLLRGHGVTVYYPSQKDSGIPPMLYGYARRARSTARYNVERLLPYVKAGSLVVSGEPTASYALKVHYCDYLEGEACSLVAQATRDLGEFLRAHRETHAGTVPQPTALELKIAYHQPCHLKTQQVGAPFLDLLREIPGIEIVNLDSGCCGMAGTFGMKASTFDLSLETGRKLFDRVVQAAPDLVASECSTCRLQLTQATGIEAAHPAELLTSAYGL